MPGYPGQQPSPTKYPGRVIAKARRPSQHAGGPAAMSPGKFSPGAPFSPLGDLHRPASASSLGDRSTPTQPATPASPRYPPDQFGGPAGKLRTASLEGSESDHSVRSLRSESDPGIADGQVAAISSTETIGGLAEAFKPPAEPVNGGETAVGGGGMGSPNVNLPTVPHNTQPHSIADTQVGSGYTDRQTDRQTYRHTDIWT